MFGSSCCFICFGKLVLLYLFWQAAAALFVLASWCCSICFGKQQLLFLASSPLLFAYDEIVISIYYLK